MIAFPLALIDVIRLKRREYAILTRPLTPENTVRRRYFVMDLGRKDTSIQINTLSCRLGKKN